MSDVTNLLHRIADNDRQALDELFELLHRISIAWHMRGWLKMGH